MATITPENYTKFTTAGEQKLYEFLRDALKPDSHCFAWYALSIEGLEPDFVVYTPEVGLVVFEVKDWLLEQIQDADQNTFTLLLSNGREERRTHPLKQAREYMLAIMNRIKRSSSPLVSPDARYQGKIRLPIEYAVVFSNITRDKFCSANLLLYCQPKKLCLQMIWLLLLWSKMREQQPVICGIVWRPCFLPNFPLSYPLTML